MVEHSPPLKNDEQHPLLKVDTGGGDGRPPMVPQPPTGWNVNCSPSKKSFCHRWPAWWMSGLMPGIISGLLLGLFILINYGLGTMGILRRSPVLVLNCNDTSPTRQVHYHYLVEEGVDVPYKKLSEYLSYMGTQYPALRFNVAFLITNNNRNRYRRSPLPFYLKTGGTISDLQLFRNFHVKFPNINMTVMSLPKFMMTTPWRYKWKKIPSSHLIFYLRAYSVWKYGGIGMDLESFSNRFRYHHLEDPTIMEILRQHQNGIKTDDHSFPLNKVEREEQNEFVSHFYGIIQHILNETRSFINRSLSSSENNTESNFPKQIVRTHRNKREIAESNKTVPDHPFEVMNATTEQVNTTDITVLEASYRNTDHDLVINNNNLELLMFGKGLPTETITDTQAYGINKYEGNKTDSKIKIPDPQVLYNFSISIFSDNLGPAYISPEMFMPPLYPIINENYYEQDQEMINIVSPSKRNLSYLLSIALDGSFIAATTNQHPFLGHIISTACQRLPPRFAIQDAILTQCPAKFSDSFYCGNIFLL